MQLKYHENPGFVAWSSSKSHSELLISAGFQPNQSGNYPIDVLSLDLTQSNKNLNLLGNSYSQVAFRCISWDFYNENEKFPYGVLFGGMDDGTFSLWNPAEIVNSYKMNKQATTSDGLIFSEEPEEENYPIMCAEWNHLKNHFLAFGSTDVLILDVNEKIYGPQVVSHSEYNPHDGSYITSVSWNKEVAHILASASENGVIALWDIRQKEPIFKFKDSSHSTGDRNVTICWSRNVSTQIAVTLDDERKSQLQIWDLRNKKGPIEVIDKGHTKGIHSMDWCDTDSALILTAGRDKKVICWDYSQDEEMVTETEQKDNILEVKWSKKIPGIYSVTTDKKIAICTLNDTNLFSYVPKWYKVAVSSSFHSNQKIVTYEESRGNVLHQVSIKPRKVSKQLDTGLQELEELVQGGDNEYDEEQEFWKLITAKNNSNDDSEIYSFLGFNKSKIIKEVEKYTGKKRESVPSQVGNTEKVKAHQKGKAKAYTNIMGQEAASFFATIGSENKPQKEDEEENNEDVKYDMVPRNFNWDIGKEKLIKQNMLIGNYDGAIDAALKCGRTAQALIMAYSVDQDTFNRTLKTFFTETTDNFITDILRHITNKDTQELVRKYDLKKWKECVAIIFSVSTNEKRIQLLKMLAVRLKGLNENEQKDQVLQSSNPAILCYVLAEDFSEISKTYFDSLNAFDPNSKKRRVTAVQYSKRLISIYNTLTTSVTVNTYFALILRETAYVALENYHKMLAYLIFSKFIPESSAMPMDCLIHSLEELKQYRDSVPFQPAVLPVMQKKENPGNRNTSQKGAFNPSNPSRNEPAKKMPKARPIFPPKNEEEVNTNRFPGTNAPEPEPEYEQPKAAKTKKGPPPPPPASIHKPVKQAEDGQQERKGDNQRKGVPPPPHLNTKVPTKQEQYQQPPPPPPQQASFNQQQQAPFNPHQQSQQQAPFNPHQQGPSQSQPQSPPQQSQVRRVPPPPPMQTKQQQPQQQQQQPQQPQQQQPSQQQPVNQVREVEQAPYRVVKKTSGVVPPPPPGRKKEVAEQVYDNPRSKQSIPPPAETLQKQAVKAQRSPPPPFQQNYQSEEPEKQVREEPPVNMRVPPPPSNNVRRTPPPPPRRG